MTTGRGEERDYFGKSTLISLWLALRIAAGMYVAVLAMRGAVHFGATPLEAGFATLVGAMVWFVIFVLEVVKASEIKADGLIQEWRDSNEYRA